MSRLEVRREVKVELSVEEAAAWYAALDSSNQAAFFNHVGKAAQTWEAPGFDTQAYSIVRSVFLGYEGTQVLRSLSEHFAATDRVPA